MRWLIWIMVSVSLCVGADPAQSDQQLSEVKALLRELQDTESTGKATDRIEDLANKDVSARKYIATQLPALIEKNSIGPVWLNAVRLAGDLKIVEAVPVLVMSLRQDNVGGSTTFAEAERLDNDAAGKALVKIGSPAIQPVSQLLENRDMNVRWRAALVLVNIDSPVARQVLHRHISNEGDSGLREFIRKKLG